MMIFAPAGGGDIPTATAGVVVGFALTPSSSGSGLSPSLAEGAAIGFGVAVVLIGFFVLARRGRKPAKKIAPKPQPQKP